MATFRRNPEILTEFPFPCGVAPNVPRYVITDEHKSLAEKNIEHVERDVDLKKYWMPDSACKVCFIFEYLF
jgi:hypothetical protein